MITRSGLSCFQAFSKHKSPRNKPNPYIRPMYYPFVKDKLARSMILPIYEAPICSTVVKISPTHIQTIFIYKSYTK